MWSVGGTPWGQEAGGVGGRERSRPGQGPVRREGAGKRTLAEEEMGGGPARQRPRHGGGIRGALYVRWGRGGGLGKAWREG